MIKDTPLLFTRFSRPLGRRRYAPTLSRHGSADVFSLDY